MGAFSHPDRTIVAVSDRMFSHGVDDASVVTGDNAANTLLFLHGDWFALLSDDPGHGIDVLKQAASTLKPRRTYQGWEVAAAVSAAWKRKKADVAEASVLSAYGLTMNQFIQNKRKLRPGLSDQLAFKLDKVDPQCDFILCGFDRDAYPNVIAVERGKVSNYDWLGHWAIGSGSEVALSSLDSRQQSHRNDTATTLHNLLEARFAAESDPHVGKGETAAIIMKHKSLPKVVGGHSILLIKNAWRRMRDQIPPEVLDLVHAAIREAR